MRTFAMVLSSHHPALHGQPVCPRRSDSGQFQYCDFRSSAQADGEAGGPDATVDVELLPAGFFVPSADVGCLKAAEAEAASEELERQLATVRVPGQRQVNAQPGRTVE